MGTHPIFESDFDCLTDMEVDENEDNQHKRPHSPETQESSCKRARYENELERMMSDTSLSGNETDNARSKSRFDAKDSNSPKENQKEAETDTKEKIQANVNTSMIHFLFIYKATCSK